MALEQGDDSTNRGKTVTVATPLGKVVEAGALSA